MAGILTNLQNLLEYECERLIEHYVTHDGTARDRRFQSTIANGYVSFKNKYDWMLARSLITRNEWDVMEEVRRLRNDFVHSRPVEARRRFKTICPASLRTVRRPIFLASIGHFGHRLFKIGFSRRNGGFASERHDGPDCEATLPARAAPVLPHHSRYGTDISGSGSNRTYQIMKADFAADGSVPPGATRGDRTATANRSRRLRPVRVHPAGMSSS